MPMDRESLLNSVPIWRQPGAEVHDDDDDNVGQRRLFSATPIAVGNNAVLQMAFDKPSAPSDEETG